MNGLYSLIARPYIPPPEIARLPMNRRIDSAGFKGGRTITRPGPAVIDDAQSSILIARNLKLASTNGKTKTTGNRLNTLI